MSLYESWRLSRIQALAHEQYQTRLPSAAHIKQYLGGPEHRWTMVRPGRRELDQLFPRLGNLGTAIAAARGRA